MHDGMSTTGELRLLGTFEFTVNDQPIKSFRSDKVRALFAWLMVEQGRVHQRSVPAALLWGDFSDKMALKNLRMSLSNLKKTLVDNDLPGVLAISRSEVQAIANGTLRCDVTELLQLLNNVRQTASDNGGLTHQQVEQLERAVALYRGEFLVGLTIGDADAYEQWRTVTREHIHEQVVHALEQLIFNAERHGNFDRVQQFANRLVALTPWHERAHLALMKSFVHAGVRSKALAQFESCQSLLWEELGVEPSDELIAFYERVAQGDAEVETQVNRDTSHARHNFPRTLPPFFGRNAERVQVANLLRDTNYPLVTLVGEGGIGKTHLAINIGQDLLDEFAGGVWFVPLEHVQAHAIERGDQPVLQAIAESIGIELSRTSAPLQTLSTWIANRPTLLILDNLEHLLASRGLTLVLSELLNQALNLTILATSRAPLRLRAESVFRLRGLPIPDSAESATGRSTLQLFADRCQRASGKPLDASSIDSVIAICEAVEGSPLAIELAAGWSTHMTVDEIAQTLKTDLLELFTDAVDVPDRHRSLDAVFEYSWTLLDEREQSVLAALSVFADSFDAKSAKAAANASLRTLSALADKSLLRIDSSSTNASRYAMPTAVRLLCQANLAENPVLYQSTHSAFADYFSTLLLANAERLKFNLDPALADQLAEEIPNIQRAWAWLISTEQWPVIMACIEPIFFLFDTRSRYRDGLNLFAMVHNTVASVRDLQGLSAAAAARVGWFQYLLGKPPTAQTLLEQALNIQAQKGDTKNAVFSQNYLGAVRMHGGELAQARSDVNAALNGAKRHDDVLGQIIAHNLLGRIALFERNSAEATTHIERSLVLARSVNHVRSISFSLEYLGRIAMLEERYTHARRLLDECLEIRSMLDDKRGRGVCLTLLGELAEHQQMDDEAYAFYGEAYDMFDAIGNVAGMSEALTQLGLLQLRRGEIRQSRNTLHSVLSNRHPVISEQLQLTALLGVLRLSIDEGDVSTAIALHEWLRERDLSDEQLDDCAMIEKELVDLAGSAPVSRSFAGLSANAVVAHLW